MISLKKKVSYPNRSNGMSETDCCLNPSRSMCSVISEVSSLFTGAASLMFRRLWLAFGLSCPRPHLNFSPSFLHRPKLYCDQHDMKLGSACSQCRNGKRKCDKSAPGTACNQCIKRNLKCSSLSRPTSSQAKLLPSGPTSDASSILPSAEIIGELIDLYICYIHDKPHTLFHEPSLRQAARDGSLSHAVLFGIAGLSARQE